MDFLQTQMFIVLLLICLCCWLILNVLQEIQQKHFFFTKAEANYYFRVKKLVITCHIYILTQVLCRNEKLGKSKYSISIQGQTHNFYLNNFHTKIHKSLQISFNILPTIHILNEPKYVYICGFGKNINSKVSGDLKTKENAGLLSKLLVNNANMVSTTR